MRTTIDPAGRIVVPKALRDELGLTGGQELEIIARDGRLEVEVPPATPHLERRGAVVVAVPDHERPSLTADEVRATLERVRRRGHRAHRPIGRCHAPDAGRAGPVHA